MNPTKQAPLPFAPRSGGAALNDAEPRGRRYPFIRPGQIICGAASLGHSRDWVQHVMGIKRRVDEGKQRRDAQRAGEAPEASPRPEPPPADETEEQRRYRGYGEFLRRTRANAAEDSVLEQVAHPDSQPSCEAIQVEHGDVPHAPLDA